MKKKIENLEQKIKWLKSMLKFLRRDKKNSNKYPFLCDYLNEAIGYDVEQTGREFPEFKNELNKLISHKSYIKYNPNPYNCLGRKPFAYWSKYDFKNRELFLKDFIKKLENEKD